MPDDRTVPPAGSNTAPEDPTPAWRPNSSDSSPPGTDRVRLPGYEILGELGRGGMGVVYKARQVKLDRLVALKMILSAGHAGESELLRFRREAEAIARLRHPNIVQVYEVGEHEGLPFFSLEFCDGGSLDKKLAGNPLPPQEAAQLVETLARAMQAAHQANVIHRDLKPANVLLVSDESVSGEWSDPATRRPTTHHSPLTTHQPKITDFGLARKLDEAGQTQTGAIMGTPSYMAPEQAEGRKDVGPLADVYALGAILYELLTGRPPFRAAAPLETLLQVIADDPVPPVQLQPRTPRDLDTICLKCLRKSPAQRYGSAAELAADLSRYLAGEPIRARSTPLWERAMKWVRRRPAAAALLAVSVLAITGFLVGGAWYNFQLKEERDYAQRQEEIAEKKRGEAQAARDEAEKKREWAERNFRKANEAVDAMLAEVGESWLRNIPQAEPVRKVLLGKALAFYQEFLRDKGDDPDLQRQVAIAHQRVAKIQTLLGEDTRAEENLKQAIAASRALVAGYPREARYRIDLAGSTSDLASLQARLGRTNLAIKANEEAIGLLEQLAREQHDDPDHPANLAGVLTNLASLRDDANTLPRLQRAVSLYQGVIKKHPDRASFRKRLALCLNNLSLLYVQRGQQDRGEAVLVDGIRWLEGMSKDEAVLATLRMNLGDVYVKTGRWDRAESCYEQGLPIFRQEVREHSGVPDYRLRLAVLHQQRGLVFAETRRIDRSEDAFGRAWKRLDELAREYPQVLEYRDRLAHCSNTRATFLQKAGRSAEAEKDFARALELFTALSAEKPDDPEYLDGTAMVHNNLAHLYLTTGRLPAAERSWKRARALRVQLARAHPDIPRYRADLAAGHNNLGGMYDRLGRFAEAETAFQQAIDGWQHLVKAHPDVPEYQRNLGKAHYNLGNARGDRNPALAQEGYRRAIAIFVPLVKANPRIAQYQHDLAQARANLGGQYLKANRLDEAEKALTDTLPLFEALLRDYPREHEYAKDLSISHQILGTIYLGTERPAKAKEALQKMLALRQRLVRDHPDLVEYHDFLATGHATIAVASWQAGDLTAAAKAYGEARAIYERQVSAHPNDPRLALGRAKVLHAEAEFLEGRKELKSALDEFGQAAAAAAQVMKKWPQMDQAGATWAQSLRARSRVWTKLGKPREALTEWKTLLEGGDEELRSALRIPYAQALARAGEHGNADLEVRAMARKALSPAPELFQLSRVYALCLTSALANEKEADVRARLSDRYAAQAVRLLERAGADPRRLGKHPDFAALAQRPEWKAWSRKSDNQ
jgi:tetratricopeptide (TPR) repeat protein